MNALLPRIVSGLTLITTLLFATTSFDSDKPSVLMKTNYGDITLELYPKKAPKTVTNFLNYVDKGFYTETIYHRVISGFMIQGGGFDKSLNKKPTDNPITNEAQAFVPNVRGTIAMARTNNPHSATSQFFINVVNNNFLNKSASSAGYAVFGRVINGMGVVDKIAATKTAPKGSFRDAPVDQVIIHSIERLTSPSSSE